MTDGQRYPYGATVQGQTFKQRNTDVIKTSALVYLQWRRPFKQIVVRSKTSKWSKWDFDGVPTCQCSTSKLRGARWAILFYILHILDYLLAVLLFISAPSSESLQRNNHRFMKKPKFCFDLLLQYYCNRDL